MELSQIRYFILTAQLQNMSKAARVLHITQPTLSKSISNLERELGAQLFDRTGKKLVLNEKGRRFLEGAIVSVQELDNATAAAQDELLNSTLRIGLLHVGSGFLRCLGSFSRENPAVVLQVDHLTDSAENIDTNQFDLLLYPRSTQLRRYKGQFLFAEAYSVAMRADNPLCARNAVALEDLGQQNIVFIKIERNRYEPPYYACKSAGLMTNARIITNSHIVQRELISEGGGVGFVSEGYADLYTSGGDIQLRPVSGESISQEFMIGFKRRKHLNKNGLLLVEFIADYYKQSNIKPTD